MSGSAFGRARRLGYTPRLGRLIWLVSVFVSALVPLLLVDLGLIVQLLVSRGSREVPNDWVLGPWVTGQIVSWPFLGRYELCLLLLVALGGLLATLGAGGRLILERLIQQHALRVATRLRTEIRSQAFRLGTHDLLGTSRSRPEVLLTDRTDQLRCGLVSWWRAVPGSWIALGLLTLLAVAVNFWLTLLAVVLAVSIARLYLGLRRWCEARGEHWSQLSRQLSAKLRCHLGLAPLSMGYALEEPPGEPFDELIGELERVELRAHTSGTCVAPILMLTVLLAAGFLLLVVGLRPDVTVAGAVLLIAALICAYFPAHSLYRLRRTLSTAEEASAEIFAYLDRESGVVEVAEAQPLDRLQRDVRLDHITLADRHGQRLLNEVSLRIPAGERVAILASDRETPIALAGLFVRFYDPAAGRVLFDDRDICQATLDTVRGQALLVSGHGPVFPGSIADNIACGDSGFTTLQIADAARAAQAYDFIRQLPAGMNTMVGDNPSTLTPDQTFRIGLARALLREPSLLVIEEPAGPFSDEVMHELERAIQRAAQGRTVVQLPSLVLTLRTADRVLLFHEGRLEADGKHADLVQSNELYRHINYVRFNLLRNKVKW